MAKAVIKETGMFSIALLLAVFLLWIGGRFIFWPSNNLSPGDLYFIGMMLVISSLVIFGTVSIAYRELVGAIFLGLGFYIFARAAGFIAFPWLARTIGISFWVAAVMALYTTFPRPVKRLEEQHKPSKTAK